MKNLSFVGCFFTGLFLFIPGLPASCGNSDDSDDLDTKDAGGTDSNEPDTGDTDSDDLDTGDTGGADSDDLDTEDTGDTDSDDPFEDPREEIPSGTRYFKLRISEEAHWRSDTARNTLSRRILGLRWTVKGKGLFSNEFEIWPESDNQVSDARMYQLAEMFKKDPWVVSVQPVYANPDFTPPSNDEGLLPIDDPVWYLGPRGINAYKAWKIIEKKGKKPGEGVLVGLPDTGYLDHPELFHADGSTRLRLDLQYNFSEKSNPHNAHDYCDTLCGITVNKTIKLAYVGHGSTTASLIISPPGKQQGTVGHLFTEGAAQYSEVIPIRVSPSVLMTSRALTNLAKGIRYATQQGAKVISISMGGVSISDNDLKEAIKEATESGIIVLAAAGNTLYKNPLPTFSGVSIPASYEETIAVCGSNAYNEPWRDTSRGPEVDICAPAEDIRRARAGWVNLNEHVNDTDRSEGTSMSTALVAGVAALWIGCHGYDALLAHYDNTPSKIPQAFRQILHSTGHRRPAGWDTSLYGAGIIDAARVLEAPLPEL